MEQLHHVNQQFRCSNPPALTKDLLYDAAVGDAEEAIWEHLAQCTYCSSRLEEIRAFEAALLGGIRRFRCSSSERLADYVMRALNAAEMADMREHLDGCIYCREEVDLLRATFVLSEPVYPVMPEERRGRPETPMQYVERILSLHPSVTQLSMKGVDRSMVQIYGSGAISVMLRLASVGDRLRVTGTITDMERTGRWKSGSIELVGVSDGQPRLLGLIDEDEEFSLQGVAPGVYVASIYSADGHILRIQDVDLML